MRAVAVLAALGVAAVVFAVASRSDHYLVRAEFADASGLRTHSLVELAGQPVGHVEELRLDGADRAVAVLALDKGGPIGRGARASIRPANLLGEKYVDLRQGDAGHPLASGATIPASQTGAPVELDDLLDLADAPTRAALAVLVNESGIALTGRAGDFNRMLRSVPSALDRSGALLGQLSSDNRALGRLVAASDRVAGAIAPQREELGLLVANARSLLATTAARHRDLGAAVRTAPAALRQLRRSLGRVEGAARSLGPASDALRSAAPSLHSLLSEVPPFAGAARPTLATAAEVAPSLTRLARRVSPTLSRLRPAATELSTFGTALAGFSRTLDEASPDMLGVIEGWARAIQVRDASGYLFRNDAGFTSGALESLLADLRPERRRRPPNTPSAPRPARPPAPRLPQVPAVRPRVPQVPTVRPRVPKPDPGRLPATPPADESINEVLDWLLG